MAEHNKETHNKAIGLNKAGTSKDLKIVYYERKPLGPRDLLVKVHAVSVNPVDYKKRKSGFFEATPNVVCYTHLTLPTLCSV